ncbi:MAG: BON domain-containing protein [Planctomycetes bacterium]|nr:BON domain-containing protein [Planctomycetota bacterium]
MQKTFILSLIILILSAMYCSNSGQRNTGEVLSDETIKSNVNYALHKDGRIDQTLIRIDCVNGNVTLSGIVHSQKQQDLAISITAGVRGVKNVTSQLIIK